MVTSMNGPAPAIPGPAHRHAADRPATAAPAGPHVPDGLVIACLGLRVKVALIVSGSPVFEQPGTAGHIVEVQVTAHGEDPGRP
jgi:hypothetical protein